MQDNAQLMFVYFIYYSKQYFLFSFFFTIKSVLQDPSSQTLHWISSPDHILVIHKPGQTTLTEFRTLVENLLKVSFCQSR